MKISFNWLSDFIDLDLSPEQTAEKLTLIGLEVESVEAYGNAPEGVIVGEVLAVSEHPNADRLRLCRVDLGDKTIQIVCGADNVAEGQKVPVATVGACLPAPDGETFEIKKAKLRGERSEGMICAEDELGLGTDHSGIMVLDDQLKPGTPLGEAINLYQDTIIDIEITPDRPDATCHLGVARDLAAALNLKLNRPFKTDLAEQPPLENFEIRIQAPEKCHRYVGKIVQNVTIGESPAWLKNRLEAIDIRPVNNVVDATNYVMYELGQPLHAFDKTALRGDEIVVRDFEKDLEFETLDHVNRQCPAGTLFICDGEQPVAIAGVMGGVDSEVSEATTDILIESAWFDPATIRRAASRQTLQTDASYRFERGVDPELQRLAAERAAELIAETADGEIVPRCTDVHPVQHQPQKISLRKKYCNRLLGTDLTTREITELLDGLEFSITTQDEQTVSYRIPSFRPDLTREVDLVEEVGRLFDYNNIPAPSRLSFAPPEPLTNWELLNSKIKEIAKGLRFREIYSNSLISEEQAARFAADDALLHTLNPISADMTTLRPSLLHGFLHSAAYNFNRKASGVRFFEAGHVFRKTKNGTYFKGIHEEVSILFGLAGLKTVEHWNSEETTYSIFDLKAVVNSFLNLLDLREKTVAKARDNQIVYLTDETEIGRLQPIGESLRTVYALDVPAFAAEFSISGIFEIRQSLPERSYEPVAKFPAFDFDFGVIVDKNIPAESLLDTIRNHADPRLDDITVFDVFEGSSLGENKKNIAFRLSFLDKKKTLTINDVEPIIEKVLCVLDDKYSAKLRNS